MKKYYAAIKKMWCERTAVGRKIIYVCICVMLIAQLCPTLCEPMDYSPPLSSIHGILQARILELVAIFFSRGSSQLRDQTQISHIAGGLFTIWAIREAHIYLNFLKNEILPFAAIWTVLQGIMLSEISQKEKDKYCMTSLICGNKNRTN